MVKELDSFTGWTTIYQSGRVDEAYLTPSRHFDVGEYNRVNRENIDIGNVRSMAAIYGYSTNYFQNKVLPTLDFVKREGGLSLSCVSSLAAHARTYVAAARAAQRDAGLIVGLKNLWGPNLPGLWSGNRR